MGKAMLVAHVSCYVDPEGRTPQELLERWPTLTDVAAAAVGDDVEIVVVQAATRDDVIVHRGVSCHFVADYRRSFVPRRGVVASRKPRKLTTVIHGLAPDIVHLHGLSFLRQGDFIARSLPEKPVLVQDHADRPPLPARLSPFFFRRRARGISGVSFTSREQATPFVDTGMFDRDIPVFEILESSSRFTPGDRDTARAETGLHGDPCLVWVGRLAVVKDPLTVVDAFARALPELRDPHLWCYYAQAPLLEEVQRRLALDPRLAERVHLEGQVPHQRVEALLRSADFLVLASRSEGSGYAVIEAMACGTPPIVTDVPALRRITGGGSVGALVPPGDARAMGNALVTWSRRDRNTMREAVRDYFERELSFEALGRDLRAAYRTLDGAS